MLFILPMPLHIRNWNNSIRIFLYLLYWINAEEFRDEYYDLSDFFEVEESGHGGLNSGMISSLDVLNLDASDLSETYDHRSQSWENLLNEIFQKILKAF